jgi:hypothetical protein
MLELIVVFVSVDCHKMAVTSVTCATRAETNWTANSLVKVGSARAGVHRSLGLA